MKQLFPENVAFLVEDPWEKKEEYKALCASTYRKTMKGRKIKFD